jgi:hypothetical protein
MTDRGRLTTSRDGADARDDEARRRVGKDDRLSRRRPNPGTEGAGGRIAVRWLPVGALTPDKRNARIHSARQVARIANSIAAFGFNVPILVDEKGGVLAGHGRLLAAKRLRLREAPTIALGHLNEAQRRAFVIADNRLGEVASWDDGRLGAELKELKSLDLDFGIELTGFEMSEIDLRIEARPTAPCDAALHPAAPGSQSGVARHLLPQGEKEGGGCRGRRSRGRATRGVSALIGFVAGTRPALSPSSRSTPRSGNGRA